MNEIASTNVIANKGFGTGKGTTAKIKEFFSGRTYATTQEVAYAIGVPARQLSKRMSELVKAGFLERYADKHDGRIDFRRA